MLKHFIPMKLYKPQRSAMVGDMPLTDIKQIDVPVITEAASSNVNDSTGNSRMEMAKVLRSRNIPYKVKLDFGSQFGATYIIIPPGTVGSSTYDNGQEDDPGVKLEFENDLQERNERYKVRLDFGRPRGAPEVYILDNSIAPNYYYFE